VNRDKTTPNTVTNTARVRSMMCGATGAAGFSSGSNMTGERSIYEPAIKPSARRPLVLVLLRARILFPSSSGSLPDGM
jgi:hypothetical protein